MFCVDPIRQEDYLMCDFLSECKGIEAMVLISLFEEET